MNIYKDNTDLKNLNAFINQQNHTAQQKNSVAFCVDENYLPYALFVAHQFIEHHPDNPCDICICVPDISKIPNQFLESSIRFVEIHITGMEDLPVGQLSLAAYYRLFLPQLFAEEYQYIIYLDADTYINRPFYNEILALTDGYSPDFCVAAAADIIELQLRVTPNKALDDHEKYVKSYQKYEHLYRNSGVLLFYTKNYVSQNILNTIFSYAFSHLDELRCHDQSALNLSLLHKIEILPFVFNWQIYNLTYKLTEEVNPYILHFISNNKPWRTKNRYTAEYQQSYQAFFNQEFVDFDFHVQSKYEKRLANPKHKNSVRERISQENILLKESIDDYKTWLFYRYNKSKTLQLLQTPSFSAQMLTSE